MMFRSTGKKGTSTERTTFYISLPSDQKYSICTVLDGLNCALVGEVGGGDGTGIQADLVASELGVPVGGHPLSSHRRVQHVLCTEGAETKLFCCYPNLLESLKKECITIFVRRF